MYDREAGQCDYEFADSVKIRALIYPLRDVPSDVALRIFLTCYN